MKAFLIGLMAAAMTAAAEAAFSGSAQPGMS
jgi:hypothetical protein